MTECHTITAGITEAVDNIFNIFSLRIRTNDSDVYDGHLRMQYQDILYWTVAARDYISELGNQYDASLNALHERMTSHEYVMLVRNLITSRCAHHLEHDAWRNMVFAMEEFYMLYDKHLDTIRTPEIIILLKHTNRLCDDNLGDVMEFVGIGYTSKPDFVKMIYS
jgi:hypothetical protein